MSDLLHEDLPVWIRSTLLPADADYCMQVFVREDVRSMDDLLRLSLADLIEMKFTIGARHRVMDKIDELRKQREVPLPDCSVQQKQPSAPPQPLFMPGMR